MQCRKPLPQCLSKVAAEHWNIVGECKASAGTCAPVNMERLTELACFVRSHLGSDDTVHLLHR